ncbi:hypothetical protein [Verrucosispora sp. WMMC514]|uniref:hypothetical protein n=1 Tax=Verrucosispora sp. WMMC514 TaxID=3015156 RepID=UPI00248C5959|nr:hypothetical protein [Verrucosispora sp. WMMC514]WBB94187.1 hypothetical protein O7597_15160 [Verrucosispora sp. WMMC514]
MPAYQPERASSAGTLLTERTATTSSDNVPGGCLVIARNTGAANHTIQFFPGSRIDNLTVTPRTVTVAPSAVVAILVPAGWGDANGRVWTFVDGTAAEVLFWVVTP